MKYKYDIDLFAVLLLLTVTQIAILMNRYFDDRWFWRVFAGKDK